MNQVDKYLLNNDKALCNIDEDYLNYNEFAHKIVEVLEIAPKEEFVIAIKGSWGLGKSSLINFIINEINQSEILESIEFNPWTYSGTGKGFIEPFLKTFLVALDLDKESKGKEAVMKFSEKLGTLSNIVGGVEGGIGMVIEKALKSYSQLNIKRVKEDISKFIADEGKIYVSIIDDLDRLNGQEILDIFKLVKNVANFKNVIYLLAFDEDKVIRTIKKEIDYSGIEYLEKIIQFSFHIPLPSSEVLFRQLTQNLKKISELNLIEFDSNYWQSLYFKGLDKIITTPRDINRITNAIAITFPTIGVNINPADFATIEIIRNFYPELYYYIQKNKHDFVISERRFKLLELALTVNTSFEKSTHSEWLETLRKDERVYITKLISFLFPKVKFELMNKFDSAKKDWDVKKYVCSPVYFNTYFSFLLPSNVLTYEKITQFSALLGDYNRLNDFIGDIMSSNNKLAIELLSYMRDNAGNFSIEEKKNLMKALFFKREKNENYREINFNSSYEDIIYLTATTIFNILKLMDKNNRLEILTYLFSSNTSINLRAEMFLCTDNMKNIISISTCKNHIKEISREIYNCIYDGSFFEMEYFEKAIHLISENKNESKRTIRLLRSKIESEELFIKFIRGMSLNVINDDDSNYYINSQIINSLFSSSFNWEDRLKRIWESNSRILPFSVQQFCKLHFRKE